MPKIKYVTLATLMIASTAMPVLAAEPTTTIRVSYADLDLRQPADVKTLQRRVIHQIRKACRPTSSLNAIDSDCEGGATERAMAEIERHRVRYAALDTAPAG